MEEFEDKSNSDINGNNTSLIDYELIENWLSYARQLGLTEIEILGMAYFNSAIPTILFHIEQDNSIIKPLEKVVTNFLKSSSQRANILYIYREFYFNALVKDNNVVHIIFDEIPEYFFSEENNKYLDYKDKEETFFKNSGLSLDFINNIGKILTDYKIDVAEAFDLGHIHTNYLYSINPVATNYAIIMSNVLPDYLASLVECLPKPDSLALRNDLWLFSKLLQNELGNSSYDIELQQWMWYFHNNLFYEKEPGSVVIKKEWDLEDENFENKMLIQINKNIFLYYVTNNKTGNQKINRDIDYIKTSAEYLNFINERMIDSYSYGIQIKDFRNIGEKTNYMCRVFLKTIEVSFEKLKFGIVREA
jgi:hypothetical protein